MGRLHEHNFDPGFWTTQAGQRMRLRDMDDRHLANTIRFLERQERDASASAQGLLSYPFHSDDAEYAAECAAAHCDADAVWFREKRKELLAEQQRRLRKGTQP